MKEVGEGEGRRVEVLGRKDEGGGVWEKGRRG